MKTCQTFVLSAAVVLSGVARGEPASPLDRLEARNIPRELLPKGAPPELVAVLAGHTRTIGDLAFLPRGETLLSAEVGGPKKGDPPGNIRVWDLSGASPVSKAELHGHGDWIYSLAVSPDGKTLASGGTRFDQVIRFWDLAREEPKEVAVLPDFTYWWHHSIEFSPDGRYLATTNGPQTPSGEVRRAAIAGEPLRNIDPAGPVQLWEVTRRDGGDVTVRKGPVLKGPALPVAAMTYAADGRMLAAVLSSGRGQPDDGRLLLWDLDPARLGLPGDGGAKLRADVEVKPLRNGSPRDTVYDLALSRDGRWLAGAGGGGQVLLWDLAEPRLGQPALIQAHVAHAQSVVFLPGGRLLSSGGDGRVLLHDLAKRELDHQWHFGGNSLKLALAPDGRHAAVGTAGGTVYILRLSGAAD